MKERLDGNVSQNNRSDGSKKFVKDENENLNHSQQYPTFIEETPENLRQNLSNFPFPQLSDHTMHQQKQFTLVQHTEPKKKRKRYSKKACANCKKAHSACNDERPCRRCKEKGLVCVDHVDDTETKQLKNEPKESEKKKKDATQKKNSKRQYTQISEENVSHLTDLTSPASGERNDNDSPNTCNSECFHESDEIFSTENANLLGHQFQQHQQSRQNDFHSQLQQLVSDISRENSAHAITPMLQDHSEGDIDMDNFLPFNVPTSSSATTTSPSISTTTTASSSSSLTHPTTNLSNSKINDNNNNKSHLNSPSNHQENDNYPTLEEFYGLDTSSLSYVTPGTNNSLLDAEYKQSSQSPHLPMISVDDFLSNTPGTPQPPLQQQSQQQPQQQQQYYHPTQQQLIQQQQQQNLYLNNLMNGASLNTHQVSNSVDPNMSGSLFPFTLSDVLKLLAEKQSAYERLLQENALLKEVIKSKEKTSGDSGVTMFPNSVFKQNTSAPMFWASTLQFAASAVSVWDKRSLTLIGCNSTFGHLVQTPTSELMDNFSILNFCPKSSIPHCKIFLLTLTNSKAKVVQLKVMWTLKNEKRITLSTKFHLEDSFFWCEQQETKICDDEFYIDNIHHKKTYEIECSKRVSLQSCPNQHDRISTFLEFLSKVQHEQEIRDKSIFKCRNMSQDSIQGRETPSEIPPMSSTADDEDMIAHLEKILSPDNKVPVPTIEEIQESKKPHQCPLAGLIL